MGLWILVRRMALQTGASFILLVGVFQGLLLQADLDAQENKQATGTVAIVAGTGFPQDLMTITELKAIYLGETQLLNNLWIHPVDQGGNQPIR